MPETMGYPWRIQTQDATVDLLFDVVGDVRFPRQPLGRKVGVIGESYHRIATRSVLRRTGAFEIIFYDKASRDTAAESALDVALAPLALARRQLWHARSEAELRRATGALREQFYAQHGVGGRRGG